MTPASRLPDWLEPAFEALRQGNVSQFVELYAPDGVHEFPFAPDAGVRRLEGREAIRTHAVSVMQQMRFGTLRDVRVRELGDELIIEATGHHHRAVDDAERQVDYVWFITRRDGKITRFRDYMNPLQLTKL